MKSGRQFARSASWCVRDRAVMLYAGPKAADQSRPIVDKEGANADCHRRWPSGHQSIGNRAYPSGGPVEFRPFSAGAHVHGLSARSPRPRRHDHRGSCQVQLRLPVFVSIRKRADAAGGIATSKQRWTVGVKERQVGVCRASVITANDKANPNWRSRWLREGRSYLWKRRHASIPHRTSFWAQSSHDLLRASSTTKLIFPP